MKQTSRRKSKVKSRQHYFGKWFRLRIKFAKYLVQILDKVLTKMDKLTK